MRTDLRERLAAANDLRMPELWHEIRSRDATGPRPPGPPLAPSHHRVASALVALAVFALAAGFAWTALRPGPNAAPGGGGSGVHPPAWLVAQARVTAFQNDDATPTSARWMLTDSRTAAPAVGLSPDQATGGVEYLVVLEGNFVAQLAKVPSGAQAPTGTTLAFTLDPRSHEVVDYAVTNRSVHLPGLLPFRLMPVSAPSSPRVCSLLTAPEIARTLDTTVT